IARQHVEDLPPRPRTLNPALSESLETAILRCLEKLPENRFQTADDLGAALAAIAGTAVTAGEMPTVSVAALPDPAMDRILDLIRRRRALFGTGVAGLLAITVLFVATRSNPASSAPLPPPEVELTRIPPITVPPPDSLADSLSLEADTARPLAGTLRVVAPGAQILIDGRR